MDLISEINFAHEIHEKNWVPSLFLVILGPAGAPHFARGF